MVMKNAIVVKSNRIMVALGSDFKQISLVLCSFYRPMASYFYKTGSHLYVVVPGFTRVFRRAHFNVFGGAAFHCFLVFLYIKKELKIHAFTGVSSVFDLLKFTKIQSLVT